MCAATKSSKWLRTPGTRLREVKGGFFWRHNTAVTYSVRSEFDKRPLWIFFRTRQAEYVFRASEAQCVTKIVFSGTNSATRKRRGKNKNTKNHEDSRKLINYETESRSISIPFFTNRHILPIASWSWSVGWKLLSSGLRIIILYPLPGIERAFWLNRCRHDEGNKNGNPPSQQSESHIDDGSVVFVVKKEEKGRKKPKKVVFNYQIQGWYREKGEDDEQILMIAGGRSWWHSLHSTLRNVTLNRKLLTLLPLKCLGLSFTAN